PDRRSTRKRRGEAIRGGIAGAGRGGARLSRIAARGRVHQSERRAGADDDGVPGCVGRRARRREAGGGAPMNVALFDYGTGNLHSLSRAIQAAGHNVTIESDPDHVLAADALVLPGVGAFGAAASLLAPAADRIRAAIEEGFPC